MRFNCYRYHHCIRHRWATTTSQRYRWQYLPLRKIGNLGGRWWLRYHKRGHYLRRRCLCLTRNDSILVIIKFKKKKKTSLPLNSNSLKTWTLFLSFSIQHSLSPSSLLDAAAPKRATLLPEAATSLSPKDAAAPHNLTF